MTAPGGPRISRRLILGTGVGVVSGLAVGAGISGALGGGAPEPPAADGAPVPAAGGRQAGVDRPAEPQSHALVVVADLSLDDVATSLAALGEQILRLTDPRARDVLFDGPGDLTVQVGVGPRVLARTPALAGLVDMPRYAGDDALPESALGGDLLLAVQASNPAVLEPVQQRLLEVVTGVQVRWRELGYRGPSSQGVTRNPFGYHDGIIVPRGDTELNEDVWLPDGPLAHGTVCVIRRFALSTTEFGALTKDEQDAVFGRERATGVPLSGGAQLDEADITARAPNGDWVIPMRSHVRAAHPSFTDSPLMLRRSYSYSSTGDGGDAEHGLLFICFSNSVRTFAVTQQRMDEVDDLMTYVRPTATASFAILPGFDEDRPLGAGL